jgi:hypothetical protein
MPPRNFASRVNHVQVGSPVSAGNTSKSTRQLEQRTNYIREILDAIEAGRLLVRREQSLDVAVQEGDAVFWNATTKQFEPALAGVESDATTGVFVPLASADCLGICLIKDNPKAGTIALIGMAQLPASVLANMIDGDPVPGRYYLSGANAGKLVRQRPPVTVPVLVVLGPADDCETDSWVFINPQTRDFLEDHIHYQIKLVPLPAGTHIPPTPGDHHEITDPDVEARGWLPADHAVFDGAAPTGAKFGYNLQAHEELNRLWPPIPESAAILEMFQQNLEGAESKFEGLERVQAVYCKIDRRGIWWMTSCYNQVPWDTTLDTTQSLASSMSSESASEAEQCPLDPTMELILSFLKMTFATDKTVVTSLQPGEDEPIEFVNCDGIAANTGDLFAKLKVLAMLDPTLVRGGVVFKEIVDSSLKFRRGWVAEALYAGSDEVVLNGSHQELLDPDAAEGPSNPLLHQGIVRVDVQLDTSEREQNPQVIKLGDALEREYKGVTYIGFPEERDSGIRMRFNVPASGLPTNPTMKLRALIFGRAAGPFSEITMGYYRIVRPTDGNPSVVSDGDTVVTFDVVTPTDDYNGLGGNLPADRAIEVESDAFTIAAGDTVFVTLARSASASPLFQADIGFIRIGGIIVPGT